LSPEPRMRVRTDVAAAKVIDGEAIIINVLTGRYYSLEGAGAFIWSKVAERSMTAHDLAQAVSERYEVSSSRALDDVERLVDELIAEDLLATGPGSGSGALATEDEAAPERVPYISPQLATFTDMEDLLAFDPPLPAAAPDVWQAPTQESA
jgi:Coenzyme PQQ synthesis protein D (PqqD)